MAKNIERALIIALVAVGFMSVSPANCEESQVVASLPSSSVSDPVLDKAFELIRQRREGVQIQRTESKPAEVRSRRDLSHIFILGGSAAIPM
jgi:hypothetical protein